MTMDEDMSARLRETARSGARQVRWRLAIAPGWWNIKGWLGNIAVPFEVLDGETFIVDRTELSEALALHGCLNSYQCVREFEAYGVTKFAVGSTCGRWDGHVITLRAPVDDETEVMTERGWLRYYELTTDVDDGRMLGEIE